MTAASLYRMWQQYRHGARLEPLSRHAAEAREWFYLAVLHFARGENDAATRCALHAAQAPNSGRVYPAAAQYLAHIGPQGRHGVYTEPTAFAAFIRGGGNRALYNALQQQLRDRYVELRPRRLLDIGTGDGEALLPALCDAVAHVDIVEPSKGLYRSTMAQLRSADIRHGGLQAGLEALPHTEFASRTWDLAQATFSLHNLSPAARRDALSWLRARVGRILVAEFDQTTGHSCHPAWFTRVVNAYEHGLAEYDGDGGVVSQGFLMPVMFGYFDPDVTHHEQPVRQWQQDLHDAGFTRQREPQLLYDYWWAPGYLLEAS